MIGRTISHYRILEKLGEGGMGVVYRAEDLKLKRTVALKFLPPAIQKPGSDQARFFQEAEAAAKLNHPNICTIHDIGDYRDDDTGETRQFIVMEFVDGMTLREKMRTLDRKHAIDVGIQIAEGLGAAHEHGVIHRDIKPENIMVRRDGIVQIMDFGLARLKGTTRITREGSTAGTAGYMSPEQIQGEDADHRSDIFSLGVVLYELFTGELPFRGTHESALLYEIVNVDPPPMSSVKPDIEPELDRIVFECLQKEPDERYQAAKDICKDLRRFRRESTREQPSRVSAALPRPHVSSANVPKAGRPAYHPRFARLGWPIAGILAVTTVVLLIDRFTRQPTVPHPVVASILPPESVYVHSFGNAAGPPVISPDGENLAYVGLAPEGVTRLFVYNLRTGLTRSLQGTEKAYYPFWSPDGRAIGFFAGYRLKKIDASGGLPITILENAVGARGASWSKDDVILLSLGVNNPLYRVPAGGGALELVTRLDSSRQEGTHRWPVFLPDGKHFLYLARTVATSEQAEGDAVFVGSLDGTVKKLLLYTSANAAYASGYLLFIRGSSLMAQAFDASRLELQGEAVPVAEKILNDPGFNLAAFSVSDNGKLIYQCGNANSGAPLSVYGQDGKLVRQFGEGLEHFYPRFSPDGQRILSCIFDARTRQAKVWAYDLKSGSRSRLTDGSDMNQWAIWSPDGSRIIFTSQRDTILEMYTQTVGKSGETRHLLPVRFQIPLGWSPDGKMILTEQFRWPKMTRDLWLVGADSGTGTELFVGTEFDESDARFSPDGRWVAYVSDETGESEIYVKSTQRGGPPASKISASGGEMPRWGRGGKELYFRTKDNSIFSAALRASATGVEVTGIRPLFSAPPFVGDFDYSPAKGLFVFCQDIVPQKNSPITMVADWDAALRR